MARKKKCNRFVKEWVKKEKRIKETPFELKFVALKDGPASYAIFGVINYHSIALICHTQYLKNKNVFSSFPIHENLSS